ncbi:MAG: flagellar hook-associated family protein [Hyphomicrobium sp.]|uniref:flagellar hook-associated family protein n=1 Tax=Hyphomicrobium sp. TaxID=82 RepID=UPI0013229BA1|nr:flagellar hook-associated family protein [Hyphomicrobium sp.]KAB2943265.1 MAG: flagellar hook-associated family protein [Hyphomicrobium sp.]MBZ0210377.1 flagellar hook-associated family protein [Hyphomicrobium sp.]
MKTTFISTSAISAATRSSLMKVQQELAEAEKEMTTSRLADVGKSLGFRTSQAISLRQEHSRLTTIIETNTTVSTRLKATQSTLQNLVDNAQDFVGQLLGSRIGGANALGVQTEAESRLEGFLDTVNTSFGDGYLFAGVNSDVKPITEYFGTPAPASRQGVANAFLADFGITQSDPAVQNISAADMQTFLDTTFADLFNDPSWSADWSSASSQNMRNRISTSELIETSTNANEAAFRKLAKAYTMVADLGVENLSQPAFEAVVDQAIRDVNEAIQDLSELQSKLGVAQQRVSDASERMSLQLDIMTTQVNSLEAVDPNEAATRVSALLTQIETSYALTARIMGLSILDYL